MSILIAILLLLLTFINVIAPYSGTAVVTPLLVGISGDAQQAITFALFYFTIGSLARAVIFRKYIQWHFVQQIAPISAICALLGAALSLQIPVWIILLIMIYATGSFIVHKYKNTSNKQSKKNVKHQKAYIVGAFTGFLQGTGIVGGSDLRNGYLFSKDLSIAQVGATTAVVGVANFVVALSYRAFQQTLLLPDILPLLLLAPFVIIVTILGKKYLFSISKRTQDIIIYGILSLSLLFLLYRLLDYVLF